MLTCKEWLYDEDARCFEDRLSRLEWLDDNTPAGEYWTFPSGLLAKSLFEESRYCFVYAQYLATSLLGLAYMERTLAALFYAAGRNDLKRASVSVLLKEAHAEGLLDRSEFQDLERVRENRNKYAHFRKPGHRDDLSVRAIKEGEAPYDNIARDANSVSAAVLRIVDKNSI